MTGEKRRKMMKVYVDQDVCIGCGLCAGMADGVFRMNDEGKAEVFSEGDEADVQEAMNSCPVEAIMED